MPTASTRRRPGKKAGANAGKTPSENLREGGAVESDFDDAFVVPERVWLWAGLAVLLVAALFRLYALELKPLHHDEGVNAFFLTRLVREGAYQYDPSNYHGPTLYYFALVPAYLLENVLKVGMNTFGLRLIPALFGIATVWLALSLRRYIGTVGALAAAALIAVSPGAVYQSRYFIHEALFVFFTFGIVVAALRYYETARPLYLMLAFASAALLFATKETAFISVGVLGLAWAVTAAWMRLARESGWVQAETARKNLRAAKRTSPTDAGGATLRDVPRERIALLIGGGLALFVFINVLFYSSFFTYGEGVSKALETFQYWTKTANTDHAKPQTAYLSWLLQEEAAILLLGMLGAAWAVLRAEDRFAIFAAAWAFGTLAAYSLIEYKTPWLSLNFVVPMAIAAGYAVERVVSYAAGELFGRGEAARGRRGALALAVTGVAAALGAYQAAVLNFVYYDDDRYPYVYAHTHRDFLRMVGEVERLAARAGTGKETPVTVVTPDYWPLPWYLRDYKGVGYAGSVGTVSEPIVIAKVPAGHKEEEEYKSLLSQISGRYQKIGDSYVLRPGVNLVIYARNDLAGG
ncbi:MAG: flippase activity-associated protein Agl23 [Pyrinomonadaceae bacterium]